MVWLKLVHIAAIAIWSGGLICLPGVCMRRTHVPDEVSLLRLQALVRYIYVVVVSPAAFVAVGSGTALIFLRETFEPWFAVKLALVGAMVVVHVLTGLAVIRLFEEGRAYPVARFAAVTALTVAVVGLILFAVLAKPDIPVLLPAVMFEPGGLERLLGGLNPFRR